MRCVYYGRVYYYMCSKYLSYNSTMDIHGQKNEVLTMVLDHQNVFEQSCQNLPLLDYMHKISVAHVR